MIHARVKQREKEKVKASEELRSLAMTLLKLMLMCVYAMTLFCHILKPSGRGTADSLQIPWTCEPRLLHRQ